MALTNTTTSYGTISKILHWVIVLMLLMMIAGGLGYTRLELEFLHQSNHEIFGKIVLGLAVIRLALRLMHGHPHPLPTHAGWETRLASLIHWALYVVMFAYPISGWMMVSSGDYAETGALPGWIAPESLADITYEVHFAMKWVLAGLVGLHIAGALKHTVIDRDGTLRRMWFGRA